MTACWVVLLMAVVLWPSHALSVLDGAPLDGRIEAVLVGLAIPALVWLRPSFLRRPLVQVAIVMLVALKIADASLLTPHGLCARFSTAAPYRTSVLTIPIEEPRGLLRSWDLRAGWRDDAPACTAIVDRPYTEMSAFPAWFVNITRSVADFAESTPAPVVMDVSGYARVPTRGVFVVDLDRGMNVTGRIGTQDVSSDDGRPMLAVLDAGTHRIALHASLTGDHWRFVPTFDGRDAFSTTTLTAGPPRSVDRAAAGVGAVESTLIVLLVCAWIASLALAYRASPALLAWCLAASCVFATIGATGRFERLSIVLLAGAVLVPVAGPHRNLRGALLLVGVPWLALIAARSLPQIGHFTTYSNDDWLAYQAAGYRIFMNGFWLEGGSKVFDYQPLYRWLTGALHLAFGDSSVGELYWDAMCLLLGASVAFVLVERAAGFRWGIAAAVGTLATFWTGTIWYFVGRGLSEVSAAGCGFIAALLLIGNRAALARTAAVAGMFAVLMFYTRLNHLVFAICLLALLPRFSVRAIAAYLTTCAVGVGLFAARTWWYTGRFSILYGTSLRNNDTGLRPTTVLSSQVWQKIWHSLRALVWMNEPPAFDARAALVVAGVLLSVLTLLQVPKITRLPFSIAVVTLGACASAFLAHTHNYPGRMSIHLVPFAMAMTAIAGAKLVPSTR